jgi:hypothetical protein
MQDKWSLTQEGDLTLPCVDPDLYEATLGQILIQTARAGGGNSFVGPCQSLRCAGHLSARGYSSESLEEFDRFECPAPFVLLTGGHIPCD